ncbi:hypothetical protein [uncultured Megasphaera sp.]|uniref:hypothetical protein n=1 Tax=uncultured Megasphaera sp. TaxID=165188 RepID=UPI0025D4377B|nr:hypothetical protein [uncultured Megasphaera sp.]
MTNEEKERKIDEGLMMLLVFVKNYFDREEAGAGEHETVILKGLVRKQMRKLVDLLEGKQDNIIQFPELIKRKR